MQCLLFHSVHLDSAFSAESRVAFFHFFLFFFFFFFSCVWTVTSHGFTVQEIKITVHALFIIVHSTVHTLKNIKNGSHGTIHTFKNYFVTVLSVFSFSNNKFNPNRPILSLISSLGFYTYVMEHSVCFIGRPFIKIVFHIF